jgi:hypothetical protein
LVEEYLVLQAERKTGMKFICSLLVVLALVASAHARTNVQHPANWNTMNSQQQAWWLCRDDPDRVTARCKMVPKEPAAAKNKPADWNTMDALEQAAWNAEHPTGAPAAQVATDGASSSEIQQQFGKPNEVTLVRG